MSIKLELANQFTVLLICVPSSLVKSEQSTCDPKSTYDSMVVKQSRDTESYSINARRSSSYRPQKHRCFDGRRVGRVGRGSTEDVGWANRLGVYEAAPAPPNGHSNRRPAVVLQVLRRSSKQPVFGIDFWSIFAYKYIGKNGPTKPNPGACNGCCLATSLPPVDGV